MWAKVMDFTQKVERLCEKFDEACEVVNGQHAKLLYLQLPASRDARLDVLEAAGPIRRIPRLTPLARMRLAVADEVVLPFEVHISGTKRAREKFAKLSVLAGRLIPSNLREDIDRRFMPAVGKPTARARFLFWLAVSVQPEWKVDGDTSFASVSEPFEKASLLLKDIRGDENSSFIETKTPDGVKKSNAPKPKTSRRRPGINARMIETIRKNPEAMGLSSPRWAKQLKCAKSSVVETDTWKDLTTLRERERAERARDRRRKPKGSDLLRD